MEFSRRQKVLSFMRQKSLHLRNKKVSFGRNVYVGPACVIDGIYGLEIGSNVYIGKRVTLEFEGRIGNGVVIANHVGIVGRRDHEQAFEGQDFFDAKTVREDRRLSLYTDIGDGCWIGYGAIILSGVRIGEGSIIGAGAVVTRDVAPHSLVTSATSVVRARSGQLAGRSAST